MYKEPSYFSEHQAHLRKVYLFLILNELLQSHQLTYQVSCFCVSLQPGGTVPHVRKTKWLITSESLEYKYLILSKKFIREMAYTSVETSKSTTGLEGKLSFA